MSSYGSRVRKRIIPSLELGNQLIGQFYFVGANTNWQYKTFQELGGDGRQYAYNNLNYVRKEYCQDELHLGPPYRSGGPFARTIVEVPAFEPQGMGWYHTTGQTQTQFGMGYMAYNGGFISQSMPGNEVDNWIFQNDFDNHPYLIPDVTSMGPTAWRKTAPKIEVGGLAIGLGESRDIPSMLRKTSKAFHEIWKDMSPRNSKTRDTWSMKPRNVANNYLNAQFGWVPFVSDIGKLFEVYRNSEKYISRIKSENGLSVRKRKVLEKSVTETELYSGNVVWTIPPFPYYQGQYGWFTSIPTSRVVKEIITSTYAVGKFRYYRPEFDDSDRGKYDSTISTVERNLAIHGLRVNPSNLYRVMPWSWMIDWFSNVGDNVANFSSAYQDSMVSEYFYVMQHKKTRLTLYQTLPMSTGALNLSFSRNIDVKQRNAGVSPFGLSLGTPTTAFQLSILAALGISRL